MSIIFISDVHWLDASVSLTHSCIPALQQRFGVPEQQSVVWIHDVGLVLGLFFFVLRVRLVESLVIVLLQHSTLKQFTERRLTIYLMQGGEYSQMPFYYLATKILFFLLLCKIISTLRRCTPPSKDWWTGFWRSGSAWRWWPPVPTPPRPLTGCRVFCSSCGWGRCDLDTLPQTPWPRCRPPAAEHNERTDLN